MRGFHPRNLPPDRPVALVMGTEFSGASDFMMEHADAFVEIPMHGFAESFNISVAGHPHAATEAQAGILRRRLGPAPP